MRAQTPLALVIAGAFVVIGLGEAKAKKWPQLVGAKPVETVKPARGFVDDPFIFDGAGGRLLYVNADAANLAGKDALVIEFKIPLAETARFGYGIGSTEGDLIGVGLESPEVDMEKMRDEIQKSMGEGGGRPSGGGGRGGGKSGGGRGGGMRPSGGGDRPEPPEPIKLWTQVVLASK